MKIIVMGFGQRLRNGLATIIAGRDQYMQTQSRTSSLELNQTRMAAGGFSQPVWGPEINTVGAYSREGYTSKTFDIPEVPMSTQAYALARDEDVQLAINHLSSQITGGEHYWKGMNEELVEHMQDFTHDIDFDWMDNILVKEALWYGNSFWKPRLGIQYIRSGDDLMHIPISSAARIWMDRQRRPYKYEFRGSEYQGYHNPEDIIHICWNPVDDGKFGVGFGVAMLSTKDFTQITPNGPEDHRLPSLLDRKYSSAMTQHVAERRYIPRNVYQAIGADQTERSALQAELKNLSPGEDVVAGTKLEVTELGSNQRAYDPSQFHDLVQGAIFKAMNDFRGKMGSEESHSYANAETSKLLDEIGLAGFPIAIKRQLMDKLFEPWYLANPMYSMSYGGGLVGMDWKSTELTLNFGRVEKRDIPTEELVKLIEVGMQSGAINDPLEIREMLEDGGLPLRKQFTDAMIEQNAFNQQAGGMMGQQPQGQAPFSTYGADQQPRPMDNSNYQGGSNPRFAKEQYDGQPSDPKLNFTETSISPKLSANVLLPLGCLSVFAPRPRLSHAFL